MSRSECIREIYISLAGVVVAIIAAIASSLINPPDFRQSFSEGAVHFGVFLVAPIAMAGALKRIVSFFWCRHCR